MCTHVTHTHTHTQTMKYYFLSTCKRMRLEHFLIQYTKINSKWITDLNVTPETIKALKVNIGRMTFDINYSYILGDLSHMTKEIKAKINKWNQIKL